MFRVSHKGEGIDDAETIEGARQIVRGQSPGRYDVDEIGAEPFPSGLWREARQRAWWSLVCGGEFRTTVAQAEKPGRVALQGRAS
jgi:hypothetical protein